MPFGKRLEGILDRGKARIEKEIHDRSAPAIPLGSKPTPAGPSTPPPPIPSSSKPNSNQQQSLAHSRNSYWSPAFTPSIPVSTHFAHELGAHGWGNNELQNYVSAPTNSFHTPSGALVIRANANSNAPPGQDKYTSARLSSHQTLGRSRGCLTVRLTPPSAAGVWPAFWLLPHDPFSWPTDGEVDIFESWNGDDVNHTCLHWGFFNGEDYWKHRVKETSVRDMTRPQGHEFRFAWEQPESGQGGRMVWWIDGVPTMKADVPAGTRKLSEFRVIINVAIGGNVCGGKVPRDGAYDLVVHELRYDEQPEGGWGAFENAWKTAPEGHTM